MGFFDKVRESLRDKTRDRLCDGLQSLGIDAQMAERGRREEKIGGRGSLGLIDISEGPIPWINVRKVTTSSGAASQTYYYIDYGVPDSKVTPRSPKVRINSVREKTFPLFGRVINLRWKGKDFSLGIIGRLDSDISLKQPIMESHDVTIRAHGSSECWVISTMVGIVLKVPSRELWSCYQAIARHLLAEWPH